MMASEVIRVGGADAAMEGKLNHAGRRWALYAGLVTLLSAVSDGWSGKPSPIMHQLLLLPATAIMLLILYQLLRPGVSPGSGRSGGDRGLVRWWMACLAGFEGWALLFTLAEARRFRAFGYHLRVLPCVLSLACVVLVLWIYWWRRTEGALFAAVVVTYTAGMLVAIRCFPLNYLRSDMLPVIGWADGRMLQHLNPYGTIHMGTRLYDFPYLPGMLIAFWPAAFLHLDLRWASLSYLVLTAFLVFRAARFDSRFEVAALLGCFLLCPFLQYRHDLYLEPHWFTLALAVFLMQRRRFVWSALVWGVSCGLYQLSWVVFPFVLLNAFRRRGVGEVLKQLAVAVVGALIVVGPFLHAALERIANNTVGQWGRLPHALADPINLSYWLTFLIRPDQLKWVQAAAMVALFGVCVARGRCGTLTDTLRWMCVALAIFIPLNVLVDGYFYLTLALLLLFFVCAANGWWDQTGEGHAHEVLLGAPGGPEALSKT